MGENRERLLNPDQNIGRFLVDSSPALWFLTELVIIVPVFFYFASFGKLSTLPEIRLANFQGALVFAACFVVFGLGVGLYERENRFSRLNSLQLISLTWLLAVPTSLFVFYVLTYDKVGRLSLAWGSMGSTLVVYLLIHWLGAKLLKNYPHRFFYVGTESKVAAALFAELARPEFIHFQHAANSELAPTAGLSPAEASRLVTELRRKSISEVVVSWENRDENEHSEFLFACLRQGLRVVEDVEYFSQVTRRLPLEALPNSYVLKMGFDIHRPIHRILKRSLDILVSLLILAVGLPFFLLIALIIRLESRGPALYSQRRTGRYGREFKLLKFRTMCDNAESQSYVTARDDKRITRFGSILRVLHIDELPQLWNILKGEMSLVGPRPQPSKMVEDISASVPLFKLRHMVRPGLTGLAQISQGKTTDESAEMMQKLTYDLFYVRHFNIFLDLWILSRTLFRMIQSTW